MIIVGAGKVGEHLAHIMLEAGNEVTLIESNRMKADQIAANAVGRITVMEGDGCDPSVLEEADISHMDIFVSTMGRDDNNLVACEIASRVYSVPRCIARVNNPRNLRIFRKLGIEAISATTLIARLIEEEATLGNINVISLLAQSNIGFLELKVPMMHNHDPVEGVEVQDLDLPEGAIVVAVAHEGDCVVAEPTTRISTGVKVIIAADNELHRELRAMFRSL